MSNVLARASIFLDGDPSGAINALAAVESAMRSTGQRLQSIGSELSTKLSLPLIGVGVAAGKSAADFDTSMRKIAALTENNMAQVDAWRGVVREMGVQYGKTGNEAADALFFITSAGINGARAMEALEASMKGSAIGLGEVKVVADAATSAMTAYSKKGMTAARATEILAAAVKYGKIEADQLAPQIGDVTGTAAALGVSLEDVAATFAVFSRTGTNAAEAATQINSIFSTLLGTGKETEKVLSDHGLSLKALRDTIAQPGGIIEVMRTLDRAFKGNLDQLREVIPNIRAFRGVMNALAQNGKEVDNVYQGVTNSQGMLEKSLADMQGPGLQLKAMWAQVNSALVELGNILLPIVIPALQKIVELIRDAVNWFSKLDPEVKNLALTFGGIVIALGPALSGLGALVRILGFLSFSSLTTGIMAFTGALTTIGGLGAKVMWITGLGPAISAAAIAGTGLRGVIIGMTVPLRNLFLAFAPFLATGVVVAGLSLIAYKFIEMRTEVARTKREIEEQQKAIDDLVRKTGPDQIAGRIANANATIARLTKKMNEDFAAARDAATKTTFAAEATKGPDVMLEGLQKGIITRKEYDEWVNKNNQSEGKSAEYYMASAMAAQETIMQVRRQLGILTELKGVYDLVTPAVVKSTAAVATQPVWLNAASAAIDTLNKKLAENAIMEQLLGDNFDQTSEDAKAYEKAVKDLVEAQVPLDTVIGNTGHTLGWYADKFGILTKAVDDNKSATEKLKDIHQQAMAAVEAGQTPLQKYQQTLDVLDISVHDGTITWEEYDAAVRGADTALREATDKTHKLQQAMLDLVKDGVSDFVDAIFDAKTSWRSFFADMLRDIAKLIIKMTILNALFPEGSGKGGVFGKLLGFADGGFLSPGNVGLVGERGPELISGGRTGMTITPMPAMAAGGSGGEMVNLTVINQVSAIDAQSTARFFEENEGFVAGSMARAYQKSSQLRRLLGGR